MQFSTLVITTDVTNQLYEVIVMEVAAAVHMRAAESDGLQLKGTFVLAL